MSNGPTDPRVELTVDDLITLCAAVEIALPTINKVDAARYQELATKLATVLLRLHQVEDPHQVELQA